MMNHCKPRCKLTGNLRQLIIITKLLNHFFQAFSFFEDEFEA